MSGLSMRIVSEDQVRHLLNPARAVAVLEAAFKRNYRETTQMPLRMQLALPSGSVLLLMPCHDAAISAGGFKVVIVHPSALPGRDRVQAQYCLLDDSTGMVSGIIEANYLTDIRTAAISAIATQLLARNDATTLGIYGSGRQALAHALVLTSVRAFRRVLVCGSKPARGTEFAARLREDWAITAQALDADTCAAESDVIR